MKDLWNKRYADKAFAYGENPNEFFKQELIKLKPGTLLLPAEGEGRNAVFAAKLGWKVTAFDISIEGKKKAEDLAKRNDVSINYLVGDYQSFDDQNVQFDCIALIFAHVPAPMRAAQHRLVSKWLNSDGKVVLQGFSKAQLGNASGGPQNLDMLFNEAELKEDFEQLSELSIMEEEIELEEGALHKGKAQVINLIGHK